MSQIIKISSDLITQQIDDETVILDLKSESYFSLDEVGTRIWQLMQEQNNLNAITEILLAEYDADRKQLENDIFDLINRLAQAGLISLCSDSK